AARPASHSRCASATNVVDRGLALTAARRRSRPSSELSAFLGNRLGYYNELAVDSRQSTAPESTARGVEGHRTPRLSTTPSCRLRTVDRRLSTVDYFVPLPLGALPSS